MSRIGSLLLLMAASGATLYVIRATRFGEIFTDWTTQIPEALVLALPFYLALLGMILPAIPISVLLMRGRFGPAPLRVAALISAVVGAISFVLMTIAAYDAMWVLYMGPIGLDAPAARPLLPQDVQTITSTLGPVFLGAWMSLTSFQVGAIGVPRPVWFIGAITGAAVIATMPYAWDWFVVDTLLPLELTLSLLWASALGLYFRSARRAPATA